MSASPLWDMFTAGADGSPYMILVWYQKSSMVKIVSGIFVGKLDFRGPDRNPSLGPLLEIYRAHRTGRIDRATASQLVDGNGG